MAAQSDYSCGCYFSRVLSQRQEPEAKEKKQNATPGTGGTRHTTELQLDRSQERAPRYKLHATGEAKPMLRQAEREILVWPGASQPGAFRGLGRHYWGAGIRSLQKFGGEAQRCQGSFSMTERGQNATQRCTSQTRRAHASWCGLRPGFGPEGEQ